MIKKLLIGLMVVTCSLLKASDGEQQLNQTKKHFELFKVAYLGDFKEEYQKGIFLNDCNVDVCGGISFKKKKDNFNEAESYIDFLKQSLLYFVSKEEAVFYSGLLSAFLFSKNVFFTIQYVDKTNPLYLKALANEEMLKESVFLLGSYVNLLSQQNNIKGKISNADCYFKDNLVVFLNSGANENVGYSNIIKNDAVINKKTLNIFQKKELLPFSSNLTVLPIRDKSFLKYDEECASILNSIKDIRFMSCKLEMDIKYNNFGFVENAASRFFQGFSYYNIHTDQYSFQDLLSDAVLSNYFYKKESKSNTKKYLLKNQKNQQNNDKELEKELKTQTTHEIKVKLKKQANFLSNYILTHSLNSSINKVFSKTLECLRGIDDIESNIDSFTLNEILDQTLFFESFLLESSK